LRIGFGIKRASKREISLPEFLAFQPALNGREPIPFSPFRTYQFFQINHKELNSRSGISRKRRDSVRRDGRREPQRLPQKGRMKMNFDRAEDGGQFRTGSRPPVKFLEIFSLHICGIGF